MNRDPTRKSSSIKQVYTLQQKEKYKNLVKMQTTPKNTIFEVSTPNLIMSPLVISLMASIRGMITPGLLGPSRICRRPSRYRSNRVNHPTATRSRTKVSRQFIVLVRPDHHQEGSGYDSPKEEYPNKNLVIEEIDQKDKDHYHRLHLNQGFQADLIYYHFYQVQVEEKSKQS